MSTVEIKPKDASEPASAVPQFNSIEEEIDECEWEKKFAATPDEKLIKLVEQVRATIQAGKTGPLDFTNK